METVRREVVAARSIWPQPSRSTGHTPLGVWFMKKVLKVLFVLVLVFVLLVVGAVFAVGYFIDDLAKKGIEEGGTRALGVPTTLDSANVGLLAGSFAMNGLRVANPTGYSADSFLTLGEGGVAVNYQSLQKPTIELPEFTLSDLAVSLQKKSGKANYQVILDNLKKVQGEPGSTEPQTPAPTEEGEQKRFVIRQLLIRNVRIDVDLVEVPAALGQMTVITVPIDKIELSNVGQTGTGVQGTGVTMEQLISIIVQAVLNAAVENGAGKLPIDFLNDLQSELASLDGLKGLSTKVVKDATKAFEDATKQAGEKLKDATEEASKKLGEGLKGIGDGLIPGGKKQDDKKK